jgi:HlyD family secretion protein
MAIAAGAVSIAALVLLATRWADGPDSLQAPIITVPAAAPASTGAHVTANVTASGYVVAERSARVGARAVGRLAEVLVSQGERVRAGQVIARLDGLAERASVQAAQARRAMLHARAGAARAVRAEMVQQFARQRRLADADAVTRASVEDLALQVQAAAKTAGAARAEARMAQAELQRARIDLGNREVVAPMNGVVLDRPLAPGEVVGLPGSPPILELADFDTLVVEAEVPENRLGSIRPGTACEIVLDADPGRPRRGQVAALGTRVNRAKATVVVKVRFVDHPEGVLPDMAAQTSFAGDRPAAARRPPPPPLPASAPGDSAGRPDPIISTRGE